MKKVSLFIIAGLVALTFAGCKSETPEPVQQTAAPAQQAAPAAQGQAGTVVETMNSGGYTYVKVDTGSEEFWAAVNQTSVNVGDAVTIPSSGMVMQNHYSKTLDRTFEKIVFADSLGTGGADSTASLPDGHPSTEVAPEDHTKPIVAAENMDWSDVKKADYTVAEIFAQKDALAGKEISVRGKVAKFSPDIMKTNWLHLQDGSGIAATNGAAGTNDLMITTDAVVAKGDIVLVKGVLGTYKDFGFNYKYDAIIEGAQVVVE